jgi:hypothetical protein
MFTLGTWCTVPAAFGSTDREKCFDGVQLHCTGSGRTSKQTESGRAHFTCSFALATAPGLISSPSDDFSRDSQLLVAKGYPLSLPEEIFLTGRNGFSVLQATPLPKNPINLLNSVLTL